MGSGGNWGAGFWGDCGWYRGITGICWMGVSLVAVWVLVGGLC